MTTSRHYSPLQQNRTAYKPYNFVPLPDKVVEAESLPEREGYLDDRLTGRIHCTLTTLSPIYTRTAVSPEFYERWKDKVREMMKDGSSREEYSQFFHLADKETPIIPGSGLRGMVRNLVEVIGYGKMMWATPEPLVFRAVADMSSLGDWYRQRMAKESIRAGYIEFSKDHWMIRPAQLIMDKPFGRIYKEDLDGRRFERWQNCKNAWKIYAYMDIEEGESLPYAVEIEETSGMYQPYVLVKGGPRPPLRNPEHTEKYFILGQPDTSADPVLIPDTMVREYLEQLTPQQKALTGRAGSQSSDQGILDGKPWHPVFYLVEDGHLQFFGHTMMFRLPYRQSPMALVPAALRNPEQTDLAEAIFGFVTEQRKGKGRGSRAGRVVFADALMESAPETGPFVFEQALAPKILSGPKPTSFQLYLTQTDPDHPDHLRHYASEEGKTTLRGHKFYWHRGPIGVGDYKDDGVNWNTDTQHTSIRPVQAGVEFAFDIYFENLTKVELGALMWALQLPGGQEVCHSIGMGKSLGMGAVKLHPELYLHNRETRYKILFSDQKWETGETGPLNSEEYLQDFEAYVIQHGELDKKKPFREQERIQALLALLSWPGPNHGTIEPAFSDPAGRRMYVERRVLPSALVVVGAERPVQPPPEIKQLPKIEIPKVPTKPSSLAREVDGFLAGNVKTIPDEGDQVTAVVIDLTDPEKVYCTLNGFEPDLVLGYIFCVDLENRQLNEEDEIACIVVSIDPGGEEVRLKPL